MSRRTAIDGAVRRRVYLFRHGAVDYVDSTGAWVDDTDVVQLNPEGRAQAVAMSDLFAAVAVDKAVCSGIARTVETGTTILGDRDLELEVVPGLREIRHGGGARVDYDVFADIAFSHWRAPQEHATFLGGERYRDFYARVAATMDGLLADPSWHNLAIFAHGGTNAAVLGWATGMELQAFGLIDQAMCCLNVLDFDVTEDGTVVRKVVRAMNITADDPIKHRRDASDMELLARRLLRLPR